MNRMTIEDIIDRMGDGVTDYELGFTDGTIRKAAEYIRSCYDDYDINAMDMDEWNGVVDVAIDDAL